MAQQQSIGPGSNFSSFFNQILVNALQVSEVLAIRVGCSIPVTGPDSASFAVALLQYYKLHSSASSTESGGQAVNENVSKLLKEFAEVCINGRLLEAARGEKMGEGPQTRSLPASFQAGFQHVEKKQHPLFMSSNSTYGSRSPQASDAPPSWNGIRGAFTKTHIPSGKPSSFRTTISTSRVHDFLDA
eukprot:jgi/Botrbrau1/16832/Bobra.150_2s0056.1